MKWNVKRREILNPLASGMFPFRRGYSVENAKHCQNLDQLSNTWQQKDKFKFLSFSHLAFQKRRSWLSKGGAAAALHSCGGSRGSRHNISYRYGLAKCSIYILRLLHQCFFLLFIMHAECRRMQERPFLQSLDPKDCVCSKVWNWRGEIDLAHAQGWTIFDNLSPLLQFPGSAWRVQESSAVVFLVKHCICFWGVALSSNFCVVSTRQEYPCMERIVRYFEEIRSQWRNSKI